MRLVAWFQIIVGVSIVALWVVLLAAGQVPELDAGMRGIWFHLVAELALATLLLAAGLSLLRRRSRGRDLTSLALGALGYSAINSPGWYADRGEWGVVAMFAVIVAATVAAVTWLWRWEADGASRSVFDDQRIQA
jgi:hypothetical protein